MRWGILHNHMYVYDTYTYTHANLPMQEMQETHVQPLSWEDLLEKEMATHSSILVCEIPWTERPGGLQTMGS